MIYKFICSETGYGDNPTTKIIYKTDTASLRTLLEEFKYFLKGCGFHFEGEIVIEENIEKENIDE